MAQPNLKLAGSRSPQREALASAIADHANAVRDHLAAREAVEKARERVWSAQDRLAALQERPAYATGNPAVAFIAAMQEGREASVGELEGPAKTREAEEAEIAAEIEALQKTRAALDAAVIEREGPIAYAKGKVRDAVAQVLRSEVNVAALLTEAEAVEADIIARRCALMQLASLLSPCAEKTALDTFLARPWIAPANHLSFSFHPEAQALAAAAEALKRDADAALGE
jgi:predicted  nucleic acid-binding Zn-ribbon protein